MAASVDRLEDVPVRRLYGSPPVQLSPKDLDAVGILGKRRCKADAVVTIPGGFDLLQDSLDDLLSCGHDCPPERVGILSTPGNEVPSRCQLGKGHLLMAIAS